MRTSSLHVTTAGNQPSRGARSNRMRGGVRSATQTRRRRGLIVGMVSLVLVMLLLVLDLRAGAFPLSMSQIVGAMAGDPGPSTFIIRELRLPRALTAALVGFALGISGAIFQSLTRNALGSPDIIGFTMGASAGAVFVILVMGEGGVSLLFGALAGGLLTAALVYGLAYQSGVHGYRLILIGVGVSALLSSLVSYLLLRAEVAEARNAYMWLIGSLEGVVWRDVWVIGGVVLIGYPIVQRLTGTMQLMEMGDDTAAALGIQVERSRRLLLVVGTALCAAAVAVSGPIAFVALAAPQIAKRLVPGPSGIGLAGLVGAILLLGSDIASKSIASSQNIPVGVVTATAGGAYLVVLLMRENRKGKW